MLDRTSLFTPQVLPGYMGHYRHCQGHILSPQSVTMFDKTVSIAFLRLVGITLVFTSQIFHKIFVTKLSAGNLHFITTLLHKTQNDLFPDFSFHKL